MTKRVLVTGGCGFVGVNVVRHLESRNYGVVVLDNLTNGNRSDLDDTATEVLEGDIRDKDLIDEAVSNVDAIVPLAAHGRMSDSIEDPSENFDVNARGTLVVLESARHAGLQKVVMASTGSATDGDVTSPSSHGTTKLAHRPRLKLKNLLDGTWKSVQRATMMHQPSKE